jgi:hypothetical protein
MKLRVAEDLALPLDAVTQTFGVLGIRGSGKSNSAAVLAEQMILAKLPVVVVDPVGCWWGLRSSRDGKGPGLSLPIFGGRHGDVPLERAAGGLIADLVTENRLSCVVDTSEFSEGDKIRFLTDFAERLYRKNEEPVHLVLEESDDYLPQRPFRDQARCLRAFENIVRRGRARGLGITLVTQRSASVNKSVLTQVETLIVHRTTSPQDRKAIEGWIEYHGQSKELLESLPGLRDGETWVWSPHWLGKLQRVQMFQRSTFDSAATPKHREGHRPGATLADVDLGQIQERMAATIERAKQEDPRELRRQVADLRSQLAKTKAEAPAPLVTKVEVPVVRKGELARLEKMVERLDAIRDRMAQAQQVMVSEVGRLADAIVKVACPPMKVGIQSVHNLPGGIEVVRREVPKATLARSASRPTPPDGEDLTGPERRILEALAWMESIGQEDTDQAAAAFLAGYTVGGGAWNNPRGRLHTRGLVEYRSGGRLALTEAGRKLTQAPDAPLTTEELQVRVLDRLPGPERKLLRVLLEAYPQSISNEELAAKAGYAMGGGAYGNPRGRLRSLGLIEYKGKGMVMAKSLLFLE